MPGPRSLPGGGYVQVMGIPEGWAGIPESRYTRGQGWATTTRTVGKRTVRILLECGLVNFGFV